MSKAGSAAKLKVQPALPDDNGRLGVAQQQWVDYFAETSPHQGILARAMIPVAAPASSYNFLLCYLVTDRESRVKGKGKKRSADEDGHSPKEMSSAYWWVHLVPLFPLMANFVSRSNGRRIFLGPLTTLISLRGAGATEVVRKEWRERHRETREYMGKLMSRVPTWSVKATPSKSIKDGYSFKYTQEKTSISNAAENVWEALQLFVHNFGLAFSDITKNNIAVSGQDDMAPYWTLYESRLNHVKARGRADKSGQLKIETKPSKGPLPEPRLGTLIDNLAIGQPQGKAMRLEKDGTTWTPYYLKGGRWYSEEKMTNSEIYALPLFALHSAPTPEVTCNHGSLIIYLKAANPRIQHYLRNYRRMLAFEPQTTCPTSTAVKPPLRLATQSHDDSESSDESDSGSASGDEANGDSKAVPSPTEQQTAGSDKCDDQALPPTQIKSLGPKSK